MDHVELIIRRRLVKAFIFADPVSIRFTRATEPVRTEAGGFVPGEPVMLNPQIARIVPSKRRFDNGLINSEAGDIPRTDYLLLGMPTLNVKVDDIFSWLGVQYTVTGIHPTRSESNPEAESILCSIDLEGQPNGR